MTGNKCFPTAGNKCLLITKYERFPMTGNRCFPITGNKSGLFDPIVPEGLLPDSERRTKRGTVPRRTRIQGSQTFASLTFRLESNKEEEEKKEE